MAYYPDVVTGLLARYRSVPNLAQYDPAGTLLNILPYEPAAAQASPLLYFVLKDFERLQNGQIVTMRYHVVARLAIIWQGNEQAEVQMAPFVNSIPFAIDADPQLDAAATIELARVEKARTSYSRIGAPLYRVLEFEHTVTEFGQYQTGGI